LGGKRARLFENISTKTVDIIEKYELSLDTGEKISIFVD
jgi:hypothetical protein